MFVPPKEHIRHISLQRICSSVMLVVSYCLQKIIKYLFQTGLLLVMRSEETFIITLKTVINGSVKETDLLSNLTLLLLIITCLEDYRIILKVLGWHQVKRLNKFVSYFASKPKEFHMNGICKLIDRWNEVLGSNGGNVNDYIFL